MIRNRKQQGIALIIGLIMLLVLTVLGTVAIRMSNNELMMSAAQQFYTRAFHASEAAIALQISTRGFEMNWATPSRTLAYSGALSTTQSWGQSSVQYLASSAVPTGGYSLGKKFAAHHFEISSAGLSPTQDGTTPGPYASRTNIVQGVYLIGPGN